MNLKDKISEVLKDYILELTEPLGDLTLTISPENIIKACEKLKNDPELDFKMLSDLTVVDWLTYPKKSKSMHRYHVIINLLSIKFSYPRFRVISAVYLPPSKPFIKTDLILVDLGNTNHGSTTNFETNLRV